MTELRSQLPARSHWAGVPEAREALPREELLKPSSARMERAADLSTVLSTALSTVLFLLRQVFLLLVAQRVLVQSEAIVQEEALVGVLSIRDPHRRVGREVFGRHQPRGAVLPNLPPHHRGPPRPEPRRARHAELRAGLGAVVRQVLQRTNHRQEES